MRRILLLGAAAMAVLVVLAFAYLPFVVVTIRAPEPEGVAPGPGSLRAAVWEPFLGILSRHRALEIGVALLGVWLGALQFQRVRCDRFQARCDRAVQCALAEPEPSDVPPYLLFR